MGEVPVMGVITCYNLGYPSIRPFMGVTTPGAHLEEVYQEISHDGQYQLQKAKMLRSK